MHQEPRPTQPPTEPREEAKVRKSRFQIIKLEERITPHHVCYFYRGRRYCYKHNHGEGTGDANPRTQDAHSGSIFGAGYPAPSRRTVHCESEPDHARALPPRSHSDGRSWSHGPRRTGENT